LHWLNTYRPATTNHSRYHEQSNTTSAHTAEHVASQAIATYTAANGKGAGDTSNEQPTETERISV